MLALGKLPSICHPIPPEQDRLMYKVHRKRKLQVICVFAILAVAASAFAQQPAAPATLWSFLGIPQGMRKVRDSLFNRRGNHPRLERKPRLKAIADPANLVPEAPKVMKVAAEIKTAEDLAPQKIKAVKYLAKIGCGCYNDDDKITIALLAALEDCTEKVRLAAVEAIGEAASCSICSECQQGNCCSGQIAAELKKMAYDPHPKAPDCWYETSERVRNAAAVALQNCTLDSPIIDPDMPPRLPDDPAPPDGPAKTTAWKPANYPATTSRSVGGYRRSPASTEISSRRQFSSRIPSTGRSRYNRVTIASIHRNSTASSAPDAAVIEPQLAPVKLPETQPASQLRSGTRLPPDTQTRFYTDRRTESLTVYPIKTVSDVATSVPPRTETPRAETPRTGMVDFVDQSRQIAVVRFPSQGVLPTGTVVSVYRQYASGPVEVGRMQIVRAKAGVAEVSPIGQTDLSGVTAGDGVVVLDERR